jgi:hypothetical protein
MLNTGCIRAMVRHFSDEKVGGVAGEKKVLKTNRSLIGRSRGLILEIRMLHETTGRGFQYGCGAVGELFSIRTELFHPLEGRFDP